MTKRRKKHRGKSPSARQGESMPEQEDMKSAGLPSLASFLRTELPAVSSTNNNKVRPLSEPPSMLQGWSTPLEEDTNSTGAPSLGALETTKEDKTAGTPSRASLLSTDCESTADKVSSSNSELTVWRGKIKIRRKSKRQSEFK
jgi:hypothetical protein